MLEEHSIFQAFRTSKYYFYFTLLQLLLTLLLLVLLFLPHTAPHLILESLIGFLLMVDMSFPSYSEPLN